MEDLKYKKRIGIIVELIVWLADEVLKDKDKKSQDYNATLYGVKLDVSRNLPYKIKRKQKGVLENG